MSLVNCSECERAISDTAAACPNCGAVRHTASDDAVDGARKPLWPWMIGVPIALVAAFLLYGASIPQYESDARDRREICERLASPGQRGECDRVYHRDLERGRAAAKVRSN